MRNSETLARQLVLKEAAIAAARITVSHYWYGLTLRKTMQERAVQLGIIFG